MHRRVALGATSNTAAHDPCRAPAPRMRTYDRVATDIAQRTFGFAHLANSQRHGTPGITHQQPNADVETE